MPLTYQVGGVCYPDALAAASAAVASMAPQSIDGEPPAVCQWAASGSADAAQIHRVCVVASGPAAGSPHPASLTANYTPVPCVDVPSVDAWASVGITAGSVSASFGWGFAVVLLFWSLGFGVGAAKGVIRKV